MYWEGSGKISKWKNSFLHESLFLQPIIDSSNLLLQPENLYTVGGSPPEQQTIGHYRVEVGTVNHFQSIYCYICFDWLHSITSWA